MGCFSSLVHKCNSQFETNCRFIEKQYKYYVSVHWPKVFLVCLMGCIYINEDQNNALSIKAEKERMDDPKCLGQASKQLFVGCL